PYIGYGYSWGNPYYSYGLGTCWGNPYYSPFYGNYWGYSPWAAGYPYTYPYNYSPYYYGYSPYYGYGYNPYYFNSQDINSMTYAPRTSHDGFNSNRTSNNINSENNFSKKPVVVSPEMNIPKFDETARPVPVTKFEPKQINAINAPLIHQINTNPNISTNIIPRNNLPGNNFGTGINNNATGTQIVGPKSNNTDGNIGRPNFGNNSTPVPVGPKNNNTPFQNNSMEKGWGGGNSGGSGFSVPRGGTGGGSIGRPR
ncbi:MAG: hypothetical protein N2203_07695, partial [Bacteroidia bacterium]|nr:hypothetical protein [Bacteroidia bacterium]